MARVIQNALTQGASGSIPVTFTCYDEDVTTRERHCPTDIRQAQTITTRGMNTQCPIGFTVLCPAFFTNYQRLVPPQCTDELRNSLALNAYSFTKDSGSGGM
jgi:hypothetical protein